jgi:plasmid rolling circle replication initiator protein Rep
MKKAQVQANLQHLSLAAQTRYYTGLKSVKPEMPASNQNKPRETKMSGFLKNENVKFNNDSNTNIEFFDTLFIQ